MAHMYRNLAGALLVGVSFVAELLAQSPQYIRGARGGCYELTKSGNKRSVARGLCDSKPATQVKAPDAIPEKQQPAQAERNDARAASRPAAEAPRTKEPAVASANKSQNGRTYVTGPRGGCYYVTASGRKQYVDHSMCR